MFLKIFDDISSQSLEFNLIVDDLISFQVYNKQPRKQAFY
jgi:hypothetical protein